MKELAAVVEQYRRGFVEGDVEALKAIWDRDYGGILYVAQELAEPLRGWAAVERYYERVDTIFERARVMTIGDLAVDVLGDTAYAYCTFRFESVFKGETKPFVAVGRNTFILRRKNGAWKVFTITSLAQENFERHHLRELSDSI